MLKRLTFAATLCVLLATSLAADVVVVEPELSLAFADQIHPYAFAHRLPTPFYSEKHTPYSKLPEFESFTELQTNVPANSEQAKRLTVSPALLETTTFATATASAEASTKVQTLSRAEMEAVAEARAAAQAQAQAEAQSQWLFFGGGKKGLSPNPADNTPVNLEANPSPFVTADNQDTGTGYKNSFRRAVYGLRRRRMPFTGNSAMLSLNPYRRPNSAFNTPPDLLFPAQRFAAAMNPASTDFGRFANPTAPAYGGYSSFRAQRVRQAVSDGARAGGFIPAAFPPVAAGFVPTAPVFPNVGAIGDSFVPSANSRWNGEMFTPTIHPFAGGPSPYLGGGEYKFYDFYNSPAGANPAAAAGGAAAPAEGAAAPSDQAPAA